MNVNLAKIMNHRSTVPSIVGVAGFAVGATVGYVMAHRSIEAKRVKSMEELSAGIVDAADEIKEAAVIQEEEYVQIVEREIVIDPDNPSDYPEVRLVSEEEFGDYPVDLVIGADDTPTEEEVEDADEDLAQALKDSIESHHGSDLGDDGVIVQNVFAGTDEEWNYDAEVAKRSETEPFVIHKDEFFENEHGYTQSTLTYYAGDDILADEDDKPIYNHRQVVGEMLFGHGSGDPNVVYIRNDKRHSEFEILKHTGLFSIEVLALDIEENDRAKNLQHSRQPRFRED